MFIYIYIHTYNMNKTTFTIPFDCNTQIVHPMSAKFSTSIHLSDSEAFMVLS